MLFKNISFAVKYRLYYMFGFLRASLQGVKLGAGSKVSPYAELHRAGYIGNATIASGVKLGEGSYINSGTIHSGIIGAFCSIGYDVCIGPTEHEYQAWTTSPYLLRKIEPEASCERAMPAPVIEDDVWVGAGCILLRGCHIETGAIIAAGSVVKDRVPAYEIWGGIPAKFLRYRFNDSSEAAAARMKLMRSIRRED